MPPGHGKAWTTSRRAPSLRAPLSIQNTPPPPPPEDRPHLRLAVTRGLLGIELETPFPIGPLHITDLSIALPGIRFPVDLSGGLHRFRHRRGNLLHLTLDTTTADLATFAAPRLRGILAEAAPDTAIIPTPDGLLIGIHRGPSALAFDLLVAPLDNDIRLIPENARGIGIGAPPHALALRTLLALTAPVGRLVQGAIVIPAAATHITRHLLPAAGARAPSAATIRWDTPVATHGRIAITAREGAAPPHLSERIIRALEIAELAGDPDQSALNGDLDSARRGYLTLLESAPRHIELSQRIAWMDAILGDRPEGALSTLIDAIPATFAGVLGARLLIAIGDNDAAQNALTRAATTEPYAPLAALAWLEAARLTAHLDERLHALDQAIARAPALEPARWERLRARLATADLRGAKADADNLEALARGPEARHQVFRRAAAAFLERGYAAEAETLFERALRYAPADIEAVIGLARSLRAAGHDRRALDLFARAVTLAQRAGTRALAAEIELARALAEVAGDRPAAIARARAIPPGLPETIDARYLEGRYRADIGDLAGASLAFARLADTIELTLPLEPTRAAEIAAMLIDAAHVEEHERDDLPAAKRLLGLALRLRPRDRSIAAAFRRVAREQSAPEPARPQTTFEDESTPHLPVGEESAHDPEYEVEAEEPESTPRSDTPLSAEPEIAAEYDVSPPPELESTKDQEIDAAEDEALVQELTDKLRANPTDHPTAMRLADALARLGRDLDLLALLSARMEEGDEDARREVSPRRRAVLMRLAHTARAEGRPSEAELYEMMAAADED